MGYGPLVRSSCGVSVLWRDPELADDGTSAYCDGSTVYPDHIAGHVSAVAVLAAMIGRKRTGKGALVETAQADVAIMHLGPTLTAAARPVEAGQDGGPYGVFPCAGDDEWCVVDARDPEHLERLAGVLGKPEVADGALSAGEIDAVIRDWTAQRTPAEVGAQLQAAGVPAGPMLRLPEQLTDPQLGARGSFRSMPHPHLRQPIPTNARVAHFSTVPDPPLAPAPLVGEQTREIAATLLGLASDDIERLVQDRVLQPLVVDPASAEGQPSAAPARR